MFLLSNDFLINIVCIYEQNKDAFAQGNYFEVVYLSLKKLTTEKDIEATKLLFECLITLYHILPANSKVCFIKKYFY